MRALAASTAFEQDNACLNIIYVDTNGPEVLGGIIRTVSFTHYNYNPLKAGLNGSALENLFSELEPVAL